MDGILAHLGRGTVIFIAGAGLVSQTAGWAGVDVYATWSSRVVIALLVVAVLLMCRGGGHLRVSSWWAAPVAGAAMAIGFGAFVSEPGRWNGWLLAGDHLRHLVLVADEWQRGYLDHEVVAYPRGWHATVALLWGSTSPALTPEGLTSLVAVSGAAVWLIALAITIVSAGLAIDCSLRVAGPRERVAFAAGLISSALVWLPWMLGLPLALGFQTSLVAALACLVAVREAYASGVVRPVLTLGAVVVVVAQTWPLLLPTLAFPVLYRWNTTWCIGGRARLLLGLTAVITSTGTAPVLLATVKNIGLGAAANPGDGRPLPVSLMVLVGVGSAAFAVVAWRQRFVPEPLLALVACATTVGWGFALALMVGVDPSSYYPNKIHWSAVALMAPVLAAAAAAGLAWLDRGRGWRRVALIPVGVTLGLVTIAGAAGPWLAMLGWWSTSDGERAVRIASSRHAPDAGAVWTTGPSVDDRTAQALLEFYRVDSRDGIPPFLPGGIERDCMNLEASERPLVLTDRPLGDVRNRYECVPDVEVAPVEPAS